MGLRPKFFFISRRTKVKGRRINANILFFIFYVVHCFYPHSRTTTKRFVRRINNLACLYSVAVEHRNRASISVILVGLTSYDRLTGSVLGIRTDLVLIDVNYFFQNLRNGAPNQIRTDDPFLTMEVLYRLSYGSVKNGGARRDRTDDLLNANQALFQLSYGPREIHLGAGVEFQSLTIPHIENTTDAPWMQRKPTPAVGWPASPQRKAMAIIENQI